jgi:hypothetical protein
MADILIRKRSFVHVEEYLTRHPDFINALRARPGEILLLLYHDPTNILKKDFILICIALSGRIWSMTRTTRLNRSYLSVGSAKILMRRRF